MKPVKKSVEPLQQALVSPFERICRRDDAGVNIGLAENWQTLKSSAGSCCAVKCGVTILFRSF